MIMNNLTTKQEVRCPRCKKKICEVQSKEDVVIKSICPRCKNNFETKTKLYYTHVLPDLVKLEKYK